MADGARKDALEGLLVVNLSPSLGGAFVGQFFADFGAQVVLVEPPGGSPLRTQAGWPIWSRGAKSLEATLDDPAVRALAERADILIDTFRPGVLERHGLGHEQLAAVNPRLVTVSITGFGRDTELSSRKGYEGVVMAKIGAYSQFTAMTDREGPAFATLPYCTTSAAELAITGALVALYEREKSGVGQRVDTSLIQGIAAHDTWNWMISFWARKYPDAFQTAPVVNTQRKVPNSWLSYGLLQGVTKDGRWLQFSQASPHLFKAFLVATGLDDPAWENAWEDEDLDRREAFWERLLGAVRAKTVEEWRQTFDEHPNVFAEVFRSGTELLHHPQMIFDDQIAEQDVPGLGKLRTAKPFVRLSKTPGSAVHPLPALNQHGEELRALAKSPIAAPTETASTKTLPLEGVTIIELGVFYAAPFGLAVLADLGARVIKIEQLDGDAIRFQLPFPELGGVKVTQGKESLAVDFATPEGKAIVLDLLKDADLVLQAYRAGVAKRLGLDEASVRAINPDVIYHEAPGFGVGGPYGHRPAYAPTIGAGSGMAKRNIMSAVPEGPDLTMEQIKDGAIKMGASCLTVGNADGFSALAVACGQALGLLARERGAGAQGVVTTMLSTMSQILSEDMAEYAGRPQLATADSDLMGLGPLYRLYPAAAGSWLFLAAPQADEWEALKVALPGAGLDDPRFATAEGRKADADALADVLSAAFAKAPAAEWEQRLSDADIGCAEVHAGPSHDALMLPGGLAHRLGMVTEVEHGLFGVHPRLTSLLEFSRSQTRAGPGALIGEHTDKVLTERGFTAEQLQDLAARKVIGRG
jgi:crotonobetainyl-CoA:carnitine CoA-transferase CaiB-like acyl-CoA transferase